MRLGPYLRNIREQKGITLREMEERSLIRRDIIQIIESGRFEELPDNSHTKHLVRAYCDALQLDSDEIINRYGDEIPSKEKVYKERKENKVNKDLQYLKKTIYAFLIIVAILFIIWLVLLQIGSQGDYFRESKIYDQVETDTSHNEETFSIKLNKVEDKTAHYDVKTADDIKITLKGDGTLVNITDDEDHTYANEAVEDDTFLIDNAASQVFVAIEDNSKLSVFVNDVKLEEDEVQKEGTLFYQFNIERD